MKRQSAGKILFFISKKQKKKIKKSSETTMSKSESVIYTLNDMIESDLYSDIKAEKH